jgi:hypothetical protein
VKLVLSVVFTIALVVKEAVILGGFNQICGGSFPNHFLVVWHKGHGI